MHKSDIAESDPLRIDLGGDAVILDARVTHETHDTNTCNVTVDPASPCIMSISFDYIAAGQGVTIAALVSGRLGSEPRARGTLKGYGSPTHQPDKKGRSDIVGFIIGLLLGVSAPLGTSLLFPIKTALILSFAILAAVIIGLRSQLGRRFIIRPLLRAFASRPGIDQKVCAEFESDFSSEDFAQQADPGDA